MSQGRDSPLYIYLFLQQKGWKLVELITKDPNIVERNKGRSLCEWEDPWIKCDFGQEYDEWELVLEKESGCANITLFIRENLQTTIRFYVDISKYISRWCEYSDILLVIADYDLSITIDNILNEYNKVEEFENRISEIFTNIYTDIENLLGDGHD